jgi:hypothetical protein
MAISHKHTPFVYPEYVSPLPADDLIKIGSIKQTLYNEGVEKVQNRINELDQYGFSLVKEADKKYFSQEMDKFIRSVNESSAKTDFSVLPNVKNILSIGRPLENDVNILNAIEGSKELQRRQEVVKSMKPELRSAANDDYFMEDGYDWLNDGKVGSKLSSGKAYIPYVDVNSKIAEKLKTLKPDVFTYLQERSGGYMDIVTIERLTDKKTAQAIQSELDEKERMQLQLDAKYSLKSMGKEAVQAVALRDFQERLEEADKGMMTAMESYNKAKLMFDTSPTSYNKQLLTNAENTINDLRISQESAKENIAQFSDIEQINLSSYLPYYFSNYITSKARAFSYTKEEHKYQPDDIYIKNLEHNLASQRDYMKSIYNRQEKQFEASLKGGKQLPNGQTVSFNNEVGKKIEGGIVNKAVSTNGGLVGQKLANVANNLQFLNQAIDALPNIEAKTNVEKFRDNLQKATRLRGLEQIKALASAYDGFLGSKTPGNAYNQAIWNGLYTMVSGQRISGNINPKQVEAYVVNAIVNPLNEVYNALTDKKASETRIAINNSLNYSKDYLNGLDFLSAQNLGIFSDDQVVLGIPELKTDASTLSITPKSGGTQQELLKNWNELGTGS